MTNKSPKKKPLRTVSFIVHATRGVIRDHNTRRKTMLMLVVAALILLFSGSTFLQAMLNSRVHPGWFILFWLTCAWLTLTAILLAIFDLLMTRLALRREQRALREKLKADAARSTSNK
jgi:protein-S-isoprenylcysteine O-methyltransferase Ste14